MTYTTPARPTGSNYIDPAELSALVIEYRSTGVVNNALGLVLIQIAGGVWDRFRFTSSREDFIGEVCLHLLGTPMVRADPAMNLFGYFTTCAVRFGKKLREKAETTKRREADAAVEARAAARAKFEQTARWTGQVDHQVDVEEVRDRQTRRRRLLRKKRAGQG